MADIYTVISFAPVQGFIEKSRKLRDLFGSSYLLSFLSWAICEEIIHAGCDVISPALPNITQGMPNQIVVRGAFPNAGGYQKARAPLDRAWRCVVETCQNWIETHSKLQAFAQDYKYWNRDWGLWANYAWEVFWVCGEPGESISEVRDRLNDVKRSRDWTGVNWVGESSTLSGADAIAYPKLGAFNPNTASYGQQHGDVEAFFEQLSAVLTESFVTPDEELNIPELIKRMVTHESVARDIIEAYKQRVSYPIKAEDVQQVTAIARELNPQSFKDLNRLRKDGPKYWAAWFLGDGDSAGKYLKSLDGEEEADKLEKFSAQMRTWGRSLRDRQDEVLPSDGRMIYAGGDDFQGVLYTTDDQIQPQTCLDWFSTFKSKVWNQSAPLAYRSDLTQGTKKPITVSVGLVWAAPNVPQRDVLQHCREAEKAAKQGGRDRIAFRILFNGGNHLEWICPWWLLEEGFLNAYRDRQKVTIQNGEPNWTHFYNDIAVLEARHAFKDNIDVALGLIEIYFGVPYRKRLENSDTWWNIDHPEKEWQREFTGILGNPKNYAPDYDSNDETAKQRLRHDRFVIRDFNAWVINLAKIGFHFHREVTPSRAIAA